MSKYVIFDLEMCKVGKHKRTEKFPYSKEIIQIGAVMLDENYSIIDRFSTYVAPQFGALDLKIINLTGITRDKLINAPSTEEALIQFSDWIPDDAILVEWSDNDREQIYDELYGKDIYNDKLEDLLPDIIDCQELFGEKMNNERQYMLSEALIIAAIDDYSDGAHDGLVDAMNTAMLFRKIKTEKEFKLSPYLVQASA
jgi:DNA polymerase III alpha subunit (gram-positive type)